MSLPRVLLPALGFPALLLASCAKDADLYPSLSIRDEERVSGVFDPVAPEPYVPPEQSAETLGNLARFRADAAEAHRRLLAAAERAAGPVEAARGAEIGSEEWSLAQLAISDLEVARSETMVALAEIDGLYVGAQIEASELGELEAVQQEVSALAGQQDRLIAGLLAQIAN